MRCHRCRKSLKTSYKVFLDRKYHKSCYVIMKTLYRSIRESERLDDMSIKALNIYLYHRQEYSEDLCQTD